MTAKKSGAGTHFKILSFHGEDKEDESTFQVGHIEMKSISGTILFESDFVAAGYAESDDKVYIVDAIDSGKEVKRHLFILGETVFVHMTMKS